jgi:hypothetical protein
VTDYRLAAPQRKSASFRSEEEGHAAHIRRRATPKWRISARPYRVGPKSFLKASKMLDGGEHRLALFSCSGTISDTNAADR